MITDTKPLSARLRAVVPYQGKSDTPFLCHEASDALDAKDALLREAMEALAPFAAEAARIAEHNPGWDHDDFQIHIGSQPAKLGPYRRARSLLLKLTGATKP